MWNSNDYELYKSGFADKNELERLKNNVRTRKYISVVLRRQSSVKCKILNLIDLLNIPAGVKIIDIQSLNRANLILNSIIFVKNVTRTR